MASDFMGDISLLGGVDVISQAAKLKYGTTEDKTSLDFEDFLTLMVTQLQNQTLDSSMDTSEMMNQMVQMSVVQAISDISSMIEQSTSLNYAASLVGKEVTVGVRSGTDIQEITGTVTGTGTLKGEQVIFIGDDCYYLNSVMAVGRLPEGEITPVGSVSTKDTSTSSTTGTSKAADTTGSASGTASSGETEETVEEAVDETAENTEEDPAGTSEENGSDAAATE